MLISNSTRYLDVENVKYPRAMDTLDLIIDSDIFFMKTGVLACGTQALEEVKNG